MVDWSGVVRLHCMQQVAGGVASASLLVDFVVGRR